jgi:excisionase family DNA binding protein
MTDLNNNRLYTKKEVSKILRVSLRTIERYMAYGMPYKKIRGTVRIPENEFLKWIDQEGKKAEINIVSL